MAHCLPHLKAGLIISNLISRNKNEIFFYCSFVVIQCDTLNLLRFITSLVLAPFPSCRQQAFNATAVVRHMRRLQLGSSMGSSMDASNPPNRPSQAHKPVQPVQPVQSQAPGAAPSKSSTTDNNMAAPRKECEYKTGLRI